jgi:hypothetical protein
MSSNSYMQEVIEQQQAVAMELKSKSPMPHSRRASPGRGGGGGGGGSSNAVDVKISGIWRFQTVVVPPNAWVVHTRRGHKDPLHLGMGESFRYDPVIDSYIVAPATMQTLAINAKCICAERQGILVQAYVQWIVEDFRAAYQKLDFSDVEDPMRIVNVQLREQAEASIKDKVATMSIDEVLADKRPIIEELTARLRSVAEGQGLKIVQVQIKEAVISSTSVWENLQKPFREEKARLARMAELDRERAIHEREVKDATEAERTKLSAAAETARIKRQQEIEVLTARAELEEARVKAELAQLVAQRQIDIERGKAELEALEGQLEKRLKEQEGQAARARVDLGVIEERRRIESVISDARLQEILVTQLPTLVEKLPRPHHSQVISVGDGHDGGVGQLLALVATLKSALTLQTPTGA